MKKIGLLMYLTLLCHLAFSQITITESNDDIVIDNYGIKNSYPKEGVNLSLRPSLLEVEYEGRTVLGVKDYTSVTNPASSSFTDLFTKVLAIIDNPSSGGGGGITEEVDPVYTASPAGGITGPDITSWNTVTSKANTNSQVFTGTPSLPSGTIGVTQTAGNSSTALATTAFVTTADNLKANINSQAFTGTPSLPTGTTAITQTAGNSSTAIATTAFVTTADNLKANLAGGATFTGTIGLPSTTSIGNVSSTEIGYVDGVTSAIQGQVDLKAPLASPTFTGTVTTAAIQPSVNATSDIGTSSLRYLNTYTNRVNAGGTLTLISNASNPILFSQTSPSSGILGGFTGSTGELVIQTPGASLTTSTGERFQNYGTAKITGATSIGGDLTLSSIPALGTTATNFLTSNGGVVSSRTLAQAKTDLSIPTSTDYVDQTTNQAAIAGNKGFTGTTAMVDLNVSGTIAPNVNNTLSLGSSSNRFATVYSTAFINTSGATFGTSSASSGVYFRQGASAVYAGGFFPTSGKAFFQAQGAIPTDLGGDKQVQVYGSIALPTISSGIYLTAPNGTIYKLTVSNAGAAVFTAQ